ncbi:MAG: cell division protein FtsZ, partial [Planctomycetes bacterium]|nr:cell division protein FtsZ [Planctomycetota bacterium]
MADEVLTSATRGISEIILRHGDIQVDFADVKAIMKQGGDALMGSGMGAGDNRAVEAADGAIHSPLLDDVSISGATGVLVNIAGGEDLGMMEVNDSMNYIHEAVGTGKNANIIFGTVIDPQLKDEICITVIATGFGDKSIQASGLAKKETKIATPQEDALPR